MRPHPSPAGLSIVPAPRLPEHLMPKAQFATRGFAVTRILRERIILAHLEGVRRRAQHAGALRRRAFQLWLPGRVTPHARKLCKLCKLCRVAGNTAAGLSERR